MNAASQRETMPPDSDEEDDERGGGPRRREGPPDERVLAPEDLDFTEDEKVEQLDDGKFVIGTDSRPKVPAEEREAGRGGASASRGEHSTGADTAEETGEEPDSEPTGQQSGAGAAERATPKARSPDELTGRAVKEFVSSELRRTDSQYAYRIAAKTEDRVAHQQLASDDIGMAFDGLLMWYAQQVGAETSVEEALGILLAKSNIRIRYPTKLLAAYLKEKDLSPDDDISDLMAVIRTEDGLVFPPDVR